MKKRRAFRPSSAKLRFFFTFLSYVYWSSSCILPSVAFYYFHSPFQYQTHLHFAIRGYHNNYHDIIDVNTTTPRQGGNLHDAHRPYEQRAIAPRKALRLNHDFKYLYRHDDPVTSPRYENSTIIEVHINNGRDFLVQYGGYSHKDVDNMSRIFPPLLDLDVMRHLRPKMRFLKYTLGGVAEGVYDNDCLSGMVVDGRIGLSGGKITILSDKGRLIPPYFFGCRIEKTVAPRHAFLCHVGLPHGKRLLENGGELCKEFLASSGRTKRFCALCNDWRNRFGIDIHQNNDNDNANITPQMVEAFDSIFFRGLLSAVRNDIENVDIVQIHAKNAGVSSGEMVRMLISHGSNPLLRDVKGVSLVHWAAGAGNLDALKELIHVLPGGMEEALGMTAYRDGASPLHWAAAGAHSNRFGCGGSVEVCRLFLLHNRIEDDGANANRKVVNMLTKDGNSVLMWAAWSGTLDVVKLLIRNRADSTIQNRNGCSVAHWATSGGNLDVCRYLNEVVGVDFTIQNFAGNTPLSHAVAYGRVEVVRWLRDEVMVDDKDGRAADLAWDFVGWTGGDHSENRKDVFDLFQDQKGDFIDDD